MRDENFDTVLLRVQEIATETVARYSSQIDEKREWPAEGIRALQDVGLGGMVVPQAYGGCGYGLSSLAKVCEVLGQECASTAICFGMHCVGSSVIAANPTPDQQQRFLEPICAGHHITTLSLSEAGTGAHFYLPETTLEDAESGHYRLTGKKTFVTNGGQADSYVVSAVTVGDGSASLGRFSCVVVSADSEGLDWGEPWDGLGLRGNSSCSMLMQGIEIPRSNLLGREGEQIWYIFNIILPYFLVALAGTYLGVATAALEEARGHLMRRYHSHSGTSLSHSSVLQHKLGELWAQLERTRSLTYYAAANFDAGAPDALIGVMSAKAEVADCAVNVVNESMTLCGGIGYRSGSLLHRLLRDARASGLMSPTTDLLRVWTGRALLGQPLLAD
ncbi:MULTISPECIES: acyl-CoA dehydrogenase family protein [unclassified Thioalkalivibrio]|uniref:acyl-CoA dehydrogenase family protein n=1 Tax=unclassified Thioalkalivibrio TaxID=2621013 RepID=UPI000476F495|nr:MULTISPECIES: acyl-CoA dehydrogenase family protein [unclassified Thioalkalivibrio]